MANLGKTIIVAALDGTFQRKVIFPVYLDLLMDAQCVSQGQTVLYFTEKRMCSTRHIFKRLELQYKWLFSVRLSHNIMHPFCLSNHIITHPVVAFLQPFGSILNLVPLAESVVKLSAVCMQCFQEAAYTKRLGAEKEVRRQNKAALHEPTAPVHLCHITVSLLVFPATFLGQNISPEILEFFLHWWPFRCLRHRQSPINHWGRLENSLSISSCLYNRPIIFVPQVEVIGGADKYQAVCRNCYRDLMVDKENSSPCRDETPPHGRHENLKDSAVPRKVFSTLYLWKDSSRFALRLVVF